MMTTRKSQQYWHRDDDDDIGLCRCCCILRCSSSRNLIIMVASISKIGFCAFALGHSWSALVETMRHNNAPGELTLRPWSGPKVDGVRCGQGKSDRRRFAKADISHIEAAKQRGGCEANNEDIA
jgi:hypothetical protein